MMREVKSADEGLARLQSEWPAMLAEHSLVVGTRQSLAALYSRLQDAPRLG